jgi:spore coat protein CotH
MGQMRLRQVVVALCCLAWLACGPPAGSSEDGPVTELALPGPSAPQVPGEPAAPTAEPPRCVPEGGGPHWLEEGEELQLALGCSTGLVDPALRFGVEPLPVGAQLDPVTGALRWRPGLDQAQTYQLTVREEHTGEQGTLVVGVADRFGDSRNVPVKDPAAYTMEYGLPVLHLAFESLSSGSYRPATLVYRGRTYPISAKYRGATSIHFPKKSFTLEFPDHAEFEDPLVGFDRHDKLVLVTSFNDNSYLRPRLGFELWRKLGEGHLEVKTFSVVVFVNGAYHGLYTAAEHVDSDLMREHGLSKEGNLYKAITGAANFSDVRDDGTPKQSLHEGYEKKHGEPAPPAPDAFADLDELTRFVATSPDADFAQGLAERVELADYQAWWIFVTATLANDTVAKNAYHYRDPAGGRFRFIPWDLDASFGQDWRTHRTPSTVRWQFTGRNRLFARMLDTPALADPMRERYRELLKGPLSKQEVLALFDELAKEVRASALRDERKWGERYRSYRLFSERTDFNDHEGEVAYVRRWIEERWEVLERAVP